MRVSLTLAPGARPPSHGGGFSPLVFARLRGEEPPPEPRKDSGRFPVATFARLREEARP